MSKHGSFEDLRFGVGQNADGTFNVFPRSELAARLAERDREQAESADDLAARHRRERDDRIAELEDMLADDDLSDLDGLAEALGFDAAWNESEHPRGQPDNAGQFASGGGAKRGEGGKQPAGARKVLAGVGRDFWKHVRNGASGRGLPPRVYRSAGAANMEQSTMADGGVYVSADPHTSAQWGQLHEFNVARQPNLVDLGNYGDRAARELVAAWLGKPAADLTRDEFDDEAAEMFIQNNGVDVLRRMKGFDGYRFGGDAFLLGKLSDYASESDRTKGDAVYDPGVKASSLAERDEVVAGWRATMPATVDALVEAAPRDHGQLADFCRQLERETGAKFSDPGPKTPARIAEKVQRKGAPQDVTDAARGGFDVPTPEASEAIVRRLAERFEVADEGWQRTPAGYFDRKVMVRFDDGLVGEVQMWAPGMLSTKNEKGHAIYEAWQKLPKDSPEKGRMLDAMAALYAGVAAALPDAWRPLIDSWHQFS